jgi:hypothetical protein
VVDSEEKPRKMVGGMEKKTKKGKRKIRPVTYSQFLKI